MDQIQSFQRRMYKNYMGDLSLPKNYSYIYGNPVRPVVPLDTTIDAIFIIGAYPSATFATIGSETDVPVGDNFGPFSTERYFDGSRVRTVASGQELEEAYLTPLGLRRDQCWITDLVRIFLFKDGHINKYHKLGRSWPERETRTNFKLYAQQGIHWLQEELELTNPRLVITLGSEVAGILQGVRGQKQRNLLLGGDLKEFAIENISYPVIHMAHPGIVMRPGSKRNPWPGLHREEHIPAASKIIEK